MCIRHRKSTIGLAGRVAIAVSAIALGTAALADDAPATAREVYNEAVGHYREGDVEQARGLFRQAALTTDRELEARARFNLANCDYSDAITLAEGDRPAAMAKLESAVAHYRSSLSADGNDADARANIELARILMNRLRQEEQQEEQEEQQEQNQEQDEQQQQDENQQDGDKGDQQDQNDQESKDHGSTENEQENQESSEQSQQESAESQQQHQGDPSSEPDQEEIHEKKNDQQGGESDKPSEQDPQNDQQGDGGDAQQDGKSDQGNRQEGTQSADRPPVPESQGSPQEQPGQVSETGHETNGDATGIGFAQAAEDSTRPMTKAEAQKMLQAVRDRDMKRRMEKLRGLQRYRPMVERDW